MPRVRCDPSACATAPPTGHSARCVAVADSLEEAKKEWTELDLSQFRGRKLKQWEFAIEQEKHDRRARRAALRGLARDRADKRKLAKANSKQHAAASRVLAPKQ